MGIRRTLSIVVSLIISVYGIGLAKAVPSFGYPIHSGNEHNQFYSARYTRVRADQCCRSP